jgi:hypothetical protein
VLNNNHGYVGCLHDSRHRGLPRESLVHMVGSSQIGGNWFYTLWSCAGHPWRGHRACYIFCTSPTLEVYNFSKLIDHTNLVSQVFTLVLTRDFYNPWWYRWWCIGFDYDCLQLSIMGRDDNRLRPRARNSRVSLRRYRRSFTNSVASRTKSTRLRNPGSELPHVDHPHGTARLELVAGAHGWIWSLVPWVDPGDMIASSVQTSVFSCSRWSVVLKLLQQTNHYVTAGLEFVAGAHGWIW